MTRNSKLNSKLDTFSIATNVIKVLAIASTSIALLSLLSNLDTITFILGG